jgi:AraC-like DNA-binding protein
MLTSITLILIGFSIATAMLLLAANLAGYGPPEQSWLSRLAAVVLLAGLSSLQWLHGDFLLYGGDLFHARYYASLLYLVDPAFYLFFLGVLQPPAAISPLRLLHFAPVVLAWLLPAAIAIPLAFAFGALHAALLWRLVHALRAPRRHFRLEARAFAGFALIALAILVLGMTASLHSERVFFLGYALLIGLAFWLIVYLLLRFPDLLVRTVEAVRNAYAVSTLGRIDKDEVLARLQHLLRVEKVYCDENLSLASLAQQLELTPHQLSELINTAYGVGFSRHIREHRVEAAKQQLLAEPDASVLSIGLAVGFTSQSNFYTAFREITGDVPGRFRKRASTAEETA